MKKIQFFGLILLFITTFSCKKVIDDAYKNPNFPDRVPVEELLPGLCYNLGAMYQFDYRYLGSYTQNWTLNLSTTNVWDRMGYVPASDAGGEIWRKIYFDLGNNMRNMRRWGIEDGKPRFAAASLAIEALAFQATSDYHGEIVYKDAFSFASSKYDSQSDTYKGIRETCHQAIAEFNAASTSTSDAASFALADNYLCKGNLNKWKKLCYGVLARTFSHLTNKSNFLAAYADSAIFYANLSSSTYIDDIQVSYAFLSGSNPSLTANFFGEFRGNVASYIQTKFTADLMTGLNPAFPTSIEDPRAHYMLARCVDTLPVTNRTYFGLIPLNSTGGIALSTQRPRNFWNVSSGGFPAVAGVDPQSKYIFKNNAPFPLITSSEMEFIKAECYLRKNDQVNAHASYLRGIKENFDALQYYYTLGGGGAGHMINTGDDGIQGPARKINSVVRDAYVALPAVAKTINTINLSNIMLQKYIALYGHGMLETWTDLRRYHYTDLDPSTGAQVYNTFLLPSGANLFQDNNNKPVYRVRPRYNSEYVWNRAQLDLIGALNADYHTKECWFSQP